MPPEPLAEPRGDPADGPSQVRRKRRRAWILLAAAAWTAWVWVTRLTLVLDGSQTAGFRLMHGVLIAVSLAFAVVLGVVGWRMLRESRTGGRT